jgi:hypothetical protein
MGGRVAAITQIRLDLRDSHDETRALRQAMGQSTTDQFGGDLPRIPGKEALRKRSAKGGSGRHVLEYRTDGGHRLRAGGGHRSTR